MAGGGDAGGVAGPVKGERDAYSWGGAERLRRLRLLLGLKLHSSLKRS